MYRLPDYFIIILQLSPLTNTLFYSPLGVRGLCPGFRCSISRYEIESGARKLADGSALREIPVGSDEWLESEILSKRGEAVVLEPDELRHRLAARARELAKELGVERLRAPA